VAGRGGRDPIEHGTDDLADLVDHLVGVDGGGAVRDGGEGVRDLVPQALDGQAGGVVEAGTGAGGAHVNGEDERWLGGVEGG